MPINEAPRDKDPSLALRMTKSARDKDPSLALRMT